MPKPTTNSPWKYAHKDDLWLHAKDVSGSHVVIVHHPTPLPQGRDHLRCPAGSLPLQTPETESLSGGVCVKEVCTEERRLPAGAVVVRGKGMVEGAIATPNLFNKPIFK